MEITRFGIDFLGPISACSSTFTVRQIQSLVNAKKAAKYIFYLTNHAYFYVTKCTVLHKIDLPSKLTSLLLQL